MKSSLFALGLLAVAFTGQAQSKTDLKDQVTRLQTDLAETRRFAGTLTDRLAVLESQHEATERWKREAQTALKQRDDLAQRLTELEKETAALRQRQTDLEQRQAASPAPYNATPAEAAPAPNRLSAGQSVGVDDSMSYLNGDSKVVKRPAKRVVKVRPKPVRKKVVVIRKRKRRR